MLPGPNAAPDYFTDEDIETLHSASYEVHYNSCAPQSCRTCQLPSPSCCGPHAYALVNCTGLWTEQALYVQAHAACAFSTLSLAPASASAEGEHAGC